MSARALAGHLGVPTNRVTSIINGLPGITGDTALRLGHFFGTGPEICLNLQSHYQIDLAKQKYGAGIAGLPNLHKSA